MEQILNSETVQQIKFPGILGKLTIVAVATLIASVFEIKATSEWHVQLAIVLGNAVIVLAVLVIVGVYSIKNPHHATLEGSQLIAFTRLQMAKKSDPMIAIRSTAELGELSAGNLSSGASEQ